MSGNGTVTHVHSWRYERNGVVRCDCGETNAARGTDSHYATAARLASSLGKPGPMSSAEREQQRIAYIAAVDGMATVLRETVKTIDALRKELTSQDERYCSARQSDLELRRVLSSSLLARLRWLILGR